MKDKSLAAVRQNHKLGSCFPGLIALSVMATLLLASTAAESGSAGGGAAGKSDAVRFEDIPDSSIKRVILTEKAVERLGIETGEITEEQIIRKQIVGGRVIPPEQIQQPAKQPKGGFNRFSKILISSPAQSAPVAPLQHASDEEWVVVTLSDGEWSKLLKDKPVRVMQLSTREKTGNEVMALPSGMPPIDDVKRSMLKLYYRIPGEDHGLTLYHRVRVELPLSGNADKRIVVPYSAVYYDAEGTGWVYVNPEPLVFERKRINVERIEGDFAVLSDSPPVGTRVVTVGAALLYGAEVVFRR